MTTRSSGELYNLCFQIRFKVALVYSFLEYGKVESDKGKVAEILNNYFVNIKKNLGIANKNKQEPLNDHEDYPCLAIVERFKSHSSILKIKWSVDSTINFSFRMITVEELLEQSKS